MKQEDIKILQNIQLELLEEVHRICEKHNITYYMIAGTLLGAVRHKGVIPWDVDIDVAMMRNDYEKFKDVCVKEESKIFNYYDYTSIKNFNHPHAMVCKKNSSISFKYDKYNPKYKRLGIHLDIFPIDNAPNEIILREKQEQKLLKLRKLKQYRVPYSYSTLSWKRRAHYIVSALLSWISIQKINYKEQKQMQLYNSKNTTHVCSMASKYEYKKECMPKEIYGKPVLLEFSGKKFYAPEKYIDYLELIYGDYMKIPSREHQEKMLEVITDFNI